MSSPEFRGLERIDTASGTEFRRSKKDVSEFPDKIDVEVWAVPYLCGSLDRDKQPRDLGADTVGALTFRFSWKHELELRPAQTLDSVKKHFQTGNIWFFYIRVKGTEIPLTDHLILHILDREGTERAKLSGRL